jgi:uncharacterized protein with beta-barrel porin domain
LAPFLEAGADSIGLLGSTASYVYLSREEGDAPLRLRQSVQIGFAEIDGGTVSIVAGATLLANVDNSVIDTTTPVANVGTIYCDGGNLTVTGSVNNYRTLLFAGSVLRVDGDVTGGTAIEPGGPPSVNVSFDSTSDGVLVLPLSKSTPERLAVWASTGPRRLI